LANGPHLAAWDFAEQHKSEITWDLVTLCPPFVFGPILHQVSSPASLNTSVKDFYDAIIAQSKPASVLESFQGSWVDVRDLAEAHIRALEVEDAGGKRFIISGGNFVWQDWCT
jgi:nucleoside-diphosphate-sugar epimerase